MNTSQRLLVIGAALIGISGCTINNSFPAGAGGEYSYSPDFTRVSTFAIANSKPADFPPLEWIAMNVSAMCSATRWCL